MKKITWCKKTKNGIRLVQPSENLKQAYLKKAENALSAAASLKNNEEWEIPALYYAQYFSLYAILMKIGIRSEIHACTIEFMKYFLKNYFSEEEIILIETSREAREDVQYYTDRNIDQETYDYLSKNTIKFMAKCKEVLNSLKEKDILAIRDNF